MSQKYTGYFKTQEKSVVETPVETKEEKAVDVVIENPVADPVVEPEAPVASQVDEDPEVEEDEIIIGVVTECAKLNVRKEPSADAEVLTTILLGAEVKVDIFESTNGFYKVCTGAGVEGYCVEKYININ